jgi:hypothetical protein
MKAWILIASVLGTVAAVPALAQTDTYETPKYEPAPPSGLDPNYGLPSFGMRGSELPQQRTQAPEPVAPEKPDVFRSTTDFTLPQQRDTTAFALPKAAGPTTGDTTAALTTETPLYTTTEGGTTGSDTTSDYDTK